MIATQEPQSAQHTSRYTYTLRPTWLDKGRVPYLDGIRGISILFVLVAHFMEAPGFPVDYPPGYLFDFGHFAVTIFFVLSGFLITLLLLRERERKGTISLKGFYWRRILRILPAWATYMLFTGLLSLLGLVWVERRFWIAGWTFTMSLVPDLHKSGVLGHIWSLSVEEHFYLIWPLLILCIKPRGAILLALVYVLLNPVLRFIIYKYFPSQDQNYTSLTQMGGIATGCLLAYLLYHLPERFWRSWLANNSHHLLLPLTILIAISIVAERRVWQYCIVFSDPVNYCLLFAALFCLLLSKPTWLLRVFEAPILVWFGLLSYSLYLWQQLFTLESRIPFSHLPWSILYTFAFACASYYFVERPFLNLKAKGTKTTSP